MFVLLLGTNHVSLWSVEVQSAIEGTWNDLLLLCNEHRQTYTADILAETGRQIDGKVKNRNWWIAHEYFREAHIGEQIHSQLLRQRELYKYCFNRSIHSMRSTKRERESDIDRQRDGESANSHLIERLCWRRSCRMDEKEETSGWRQTNWKKHRHC